MTLRADYEALLAEQLSTIEPHTERLTVQVIAVAEPPSAAGIERHAKAILSDRGRPFRGKSTLPVGTRWLPGDTAAMFLGELLGGEHAPGLDRQRRLAGLDVAVAADFATTITTDDAPLPRVRLVGAGEHVEVRLRTLPTADTPGEDLVLMHGLPAAAALFVPDARVGPRGGLVLAFGPRTAVRTDDVDGLAEQARRRARSEVAHDHPQGRPRPWQLVLTAVGEHNRRPALLALLQPLQLPRASDLVLTADAALLLVMAEALRPLDPTAADAAWQVERALFSSLLPRLERDDLPPATMASLRRQCGAVAEDAMALRLALGEAKDSASFTGALVDGNVRALAEHDPARRHTAADWLDRHGTPLHGFDPQAPEAKRREALRRLVRARAGGGA